MTYPIIRGEGASEAMPITCLTTDKANKQTNEFLRLAGGMLTAGADDTYLSGPIRQVIAALEMLIALLAEVGLTLNESKTRIYIDQSYRTDEFLNLIREHNITEGRVDVDDDTSPRGFMCFGVPIGQPSYVKEMLAIKAQKITAQGNEIAQRLDPSKYPEPDIFCNQAHLLLLTRCQQFKGNYWVRHISPLLVNEFVETVDRALLTQLAQCTGLDASSLSHFSRERLMMSV